MVSAYAAKLAQITEDQHNRYHLIDEDDEPLASQIKYYWIEITGSYPGTSGLWSAVFVSWCVKTAGATVDEFPFSDTHSMFVYDLANGTPPKAPFVAHDISSYGPQVGDLIHNNRNGNAYTFEDAKRNRVYPSHSAIVIERGTDFAGEYALTVGGNESDSIRKRRVPLDINGLIQQRPTNPYISVIQTKK